MFQNQCVHAVWLNEFNSLRVSNQHQKIMSDSKEDINAASQSGKLFETYVILMNIHECRNF